MKKLIGALAVTMMSFSANAGYFYAEGKWNKNTISVCWEDFDKSSPRSRQVVKEAIRSSYESHSPLRFIGWGECSSSHSDVKIKVGGWDPREEGILGSSPVGQSTTGTNTVKLGINYFYKRDNGVFIDGDRSKKCELPQYRETCISALAVHEFGHTLGFSHEHNRDDYNDHHSCAANPQGPNGTVRVGHPDKSSVMNYCNPVHSNNGILSSRDVQTLKVFYPHKKDVTHFVSQLYRYLNGVSASDSFIPGENDPQMNDHINKIAASGCYLPKIRDVFWDVALSSNINWSATNSFEVHLGLKRMYPPAFGRPLTDADYNYWYGEISAGRADLRDVLYSVIHNENFAKNAITSCTK